MFVKIMKTEGNISAKQEGEEHNAPVIQWLGYNPFKVKKRDRNSPGVQKLNL